MSQRHPTDRVLIPNPRSLMTMFRSICGLTCFVCLLVPSPGCESYEKLPPTVIEEANAAELDAEEARLAAEAAEEQN